MALSAYSVKGGVEPQSENVWRQADTYNVPRMAFINRWTSLVQTTTAVEQIKTRLGKCNLPAAANRKEDDFKESSTYSKMKAYISQ